MSPDPIQLLVWCVMCVCVPGKIFKFLRHLRFFFTDEIFPTDSNYIKRQFNAHVFINDK